MKEKTSRIFGFAIVLAIIICVIGVRGQSAQTPAPSGCGSSGPSCGCGSPTGAAGPASEVKLTAVQTGRIANIEKKSNTRYELLRVKLMAKRDAVSKLIADPKSTNAAISKAMHELASLQADLQLVRVFAQRDKDKVYTPTQRVALAKSSGSCGCGTSSGGCGAPTPSAQTIKQAGK